MRVHILVLNGVFDTGLSTVLDCFSVANDLAEEGFASTPHLPRFEVSLVGLRRRVHSAHGLSVPVRLATPDELIDTLIVPALGAKLPGTLRAALERRDVRDAAAVLRACAAKGVRIGAACTGSFVLAASHLLDGQPATTSWWLAPLFRELFPHVRLDESRILVDAAQCVTAGAALAHLDLALWFVRQVSPAWATLTARYLLADARSSQAPFMVPNQLKYTDPMVERFESWARKNVGSGFSLAEAARASGTSERTLARRLRTVLGKTPLSFFQDLRIERAVHLLQTSDASLERIASEVGYADVSTLRTLLRRRLGRGVRDLRAAGLMEG